MTPAHWGWEVIAALPPVDVFAAVAIPRIQCCRVSCLTCCRNFRALSGCLPAEIVILLRVRGTSFWWRQLRCLLLCHSLAFNAAG